MTEQALTAKEWREVLGPNAVFGADLADRGSAALGDYCRRFGEDRHAVAALALYGQPFGFTRDDVTAIRFAREALEPFGAADGEPRVW